MSAPPPTQQQVHPVAPPPQNSQVVRDVAIILASYAAIVVMAEGIEVLLAPFHVRKAAIMAALGIANNGTSARPYAPLKRNGIDPASSTADAVRTAAQDDLYYRAAFVVMSSQRIQKGLDAGVPLAKSISDEARNHLSHESARRNRLDTAAQVARAATLFGPLLGWYRDPFRNSEPECIAADGHNFYAEQGTIIGLPGAVHPHCACHAGPPIDGAGMVNDAVRHLIVHVRGPRIMRARAKAS